jgi:hypothetical protein
MSGRIKTDRLPDYPAVHALQAKLKLTPLGAGGKPREVPAFRPDPSVDMKTPPKLQVDGMDAGAFFAYAAQVLRPSRPTSPTSRSLPASPRSASGPVRISTLPRPIPPCARVWHRPLQRRTG